MIWPESSSSVGDLLDPLRNRDVFFLHPKPVSLCLPFLRVIIGVFGAFLLVGSLMICVVPCYWTKYVLLWLLEGVRPNAISVLYTLRTWDWLPEGGSFRLLHHSQARAATPSQEECSHSFVFYVDQSKHMYKISQIYKISSEVLFKMQLGVIWTP